MEMQQVGTVKDWRIEKGWGFIETESGRDVFCHHSQILIGGFKSLTVGTPVEFSVERTENGRWQAVNVRPF